MKAEALERGTVVATANRRWRLADLLDGALLEREALAVAAAEERDDGTLELRLAGGIEHVVDPRHRPGARPLWITNVGQLLTFDGDEEVPGGEEAPSAGLGLRRRADLLCREGRVVAITPAGTSDPPAESEVIDARGGVVAPGLIDPHTHPVFAGERSVEFGMKAAGSSYLEIHKAGGGILSTVRATRAASFEELAARCRSNLSRLLAWGVTTCEGKSGYALETEGELRLLEVLRVVDNSHPVDVVPTLLGAHALPPEARDDRAGFLRAVAREMVPRAAEAGLALFCDAYCEDGAFTADEVRTIFGAAAEHGLGLRLHAEQFTDQGGAVLAAGLGASTADHLEQVSDEGIAALAEAGTTAVLLPGAALMCRCPWPPARRLCDAGVPVALGTDLNPGSSMTASLPLMMTLACTRMGMTCEEAWRAVTVEAARSLQRDDIGRIAPGCRADLVVFDVPDYRYVPYHYGENHAWIVVKDGQVVWRRIAGG